MDIKLNENKFIEFSIDEIFLSDMEKEIFIANIIPEFNGYFFPPNLLKSISFQKELLEKDMYYSIMRKYDPDIIG